MLAVSTTDAWINPTPAYEHLQWTNGVKGAQDKIIQEKEALRA